MSLRIKECDQNEISSKSNKQKNSGSPINHLIFIKNLTFFFMKGK